MAEFFAYRILDGKTTFDRVPKVLKPDVQCILEESGHPELAE